MVRDWWGKMTSFKPHIIVIKPEIPEKGLYDLFFTDKGFIRVEKPCDIHGISGCREMGCYYDDDGTEGR